MARLKKGGPIPRELIATMAAQIWAGIEASGDTTEKADDKGNLAFHCVEAAFCIIYEMDDWNFDKDD